MEIHLLFSFILITHTYYEKFQLQKIISKNTRLHQMNEVTKQMFSLVSGPKLLQIPFGYCCTNLKVSESRHQTTFISSV